MEDKLDLALKNRNFPELVETFYAMMPTEMREIAYSPHEQSMFHNRHLYYGGFLREFASGVRGYAIRAVSRNLGRSIAALGLPSEQRPYRILDVGCGLGQSSLIFSLLGAQVIGLDLGSEAIELARKRKAYYEERLQRRLDLEFVQGNFAWDSVSGKIPSGSLDGAFSYSAFIYIVPTERTVSEIARMLRPRGRLAIWDGNVASTPLLRKIFARDKYSGDLKSPMEVKALFDKNGVRTHTLTGGVVIPRFFWRRGIVPIVERLNNYMSDRYLNLSFSFFLAGQKVS